VVGLATALALLGSPFHDQAIAVPAHVVCHGGLSNDDSATHKILIDGLEFSDTASGVGWWEITYRFVSPGLRPGDHTHHQGVQPGGVFQQRLVDTRTGEPLAELRCIAPPAPVRPLPGPLLATTVYQLVDAHRRLPGIDPTRPLHDLPACGPGVSAAPEGPQALQRRLVLTDGGDGPAWTLDQGGFTGLLTRIGGERLDIGVFHDGAGGRWTAARSGPLPRQPGRVTIVVLAGYDPVPDTTSPAARISGALAASTIPLIGLECRVPENEDDVTTAGLPLTRMTGTTCRTASPPFLETARSDRTGYAEVSSVTWTAVGDHTMQMSTRAKVTTLNAAEDGLDVMFVGGSTTVRFLEGRPPSGCPQVPWWEHRREVHSVLPGAQVALTQTQGISGRNPQFYESPASGGAEGDGPVGDTTAAFVSAAFGAAGGNPWSTRVTTGDRDVIAAGRPLTGLTQGAFVTVELPDGSTYELTDAVSIDLGELGGRRE